MPKNGVIHVATGTAYAALAVDSAASLRAQEPGLAIDLFTDVPDAPGLEVFDRVQPVPESHPRAKLDCLPLSRFERTLFLDSDTLVTAPLGDLFGLLDRFDLALAHDVRRRSELIREDGGAGTPYAFPQMNSGVMLYRRSAQMLAFLAEWRRRYKAAGVLRDQITLKRLLWESDLRFYVLPPEFNLRRVTMLDAWEPLDATPTIVHSHRLLQHLKGGERVGSLPALMALERQARAAEWAAEGLSDPAEAEDPFSAYLAAGKSG